MLKISNRVPFSPQNPFRTVRPASSKIIFLSCEGSVTEEQYFERISEIYSEVKTKIQFVSVAEDVVNTLPKFRTSEQKRFLSMSRPKQLVEKIDRFKEERNDIYQFSQYPDDEFWIVTDVDKNWSSHMINTTENKTYKNEWDDAIAACNEKGYKYAISNPFFEMWLLLHHSEPTEDDKKYAVTDEHEYEKTNHFRQRLDDLGYRLKKEKHISKDDYNDLNVRIAVQRAKTLHIDREDLCPRYYATTMYILINKILDMVSNN